MQPEDKRRVFIKVRGFAEAAREMEAAMASMYAGLAPAIAELCELGRRIEAQYPRMVMAAERLGRAGWTAPMWCSPAELVSLGEEASDREVDLYFLQHYGGPRSMASRVLLGELADSSLLIPWAGIINQAVSAYQRKHYLIVVPALLPVFEGALASVVGKMHGRSDAFNHARSALSTQDAGVYRIVLASVNGFVRTVFSTSDFSSAEPPRLNRHWVLHGRSMDWDQADALRLLNALASISAVAPTVLSDRSTSAYDVRPDQAQDR